jgi:ABC-type polysaccharide/polyol phosphate export permease
LGKIAINSTKAGLNTDPSYLCDLARGAYESQDFDEARSHTLKALELRASDQTVIHFATWLLDSAGFTNDAIDVLLNLERSLTLSAAQEYQLSTLLCREVNFSEAAERAERAYLREPLNDVYGKHCAIVLLMVKRYAEAGKIFIDIIRRGGHDASIYYQLSFISSVIKKPDFSVHFAKMSLDYSPDSIEYTVHYSSTLISSKEFSQAISVLETIGENIYKHSSACLMLSYAFCELKQYSHAHDIISKAIEHNPTSFDLYMNRGSILCCLCKYEDAGKDFQKALNINPDHTDALRACFAALTESGQYLDAIPYGASLLHMTPNDPEIGKSLKTVLEYQFSSSNVANGASADFFELKKLSRNHHAKQIVSAWGGLNIQLRVVIALFLREIITRFGRSKLGYFWALFEPLAHIGLMVTLVGSMAHGSPPIGDSFAVFYFTGIIPYHTVTHTSSALMHAIQGNKHVLQIPLITTMDVFLARGILELATEACVAVILLAAMNLVGITAFPLNILGVIQAFLLLWIVGLGVGMLNACICSYFHSWDKIWGAMAAILYFSSGTFYIPAMMPDGIRNVLAWNPILQGIEMMRSNFFNGHNPPWLSVNYLICLSLFVLTLGLCCEYITRKRLTSH